MSHMDNNKKVVLTIDDEEIIRDSFRYYLEDYGFKVLEAENGRTGLEVFRLEQPDLVLVDLRMPEVDGLEVLSSVTKDSPDTPIIVISGTGIIDDAVEALRSGAWDYLLKPIEDLTVLLHAVNTCLERSHLIKENRQYKEHLEEMVHIRTSQLEEANKELVETRMQIIRRLAKAAEYKDNETGRHVIRVGLYSALLAEKLDLPPETIDLIRQCSPMHDLGKIGIPDRIMQKPGPLDEDEQKIMYRHCKIGSKMLEPLEKDDLVLYKSHTTIGEDILGGSDSKMLETARKIAAFHHEHWDGTGYPRRLKGKEIPIEARIVAIADIYDALSSKRAYKEPFPEEKCQQIIRELSGNYLDPNLVDVFFKNINKILTIKNAWKD
jgi:cyclic di-GMP phosphodiesterase